MRSIATLTLGSLTLAAIATAQPQASATNLVGSGGLSPSGGNSPQGNTKVLPNGSNLFKAVHRGFNAWAYSAVREHTLFAQGGIASRYRESIVVKPKRAGQIDFSLVLEQVLNGPSSVVQRKAFELHAGFLFHYRDFRVHDVAEARRNYRVTPAGVFPKFGRTLLAFRVEPRQSLVSSYRIVVDQESGTVLDQVEFDPKGGAVRSLNYVGLLFGAAELPKGRGWWKPWIKVTQHVDLAAAARTAGFDSRPPTSVSDGFVMHRVQTAERDRVPHVVLVYTDGIDTRFVIQSAATEPLSAQGGKTAPLLPVNRYRVGPVTQYLVRRHKGLQHLVIGTFYDEGVPKLLRALLK